MPDSPARSGLHLSLAQLLRRSLLHRQSRALYAWIALSVSAAISTSLLSLYHGLDAKLHREFRTFGANVLVTVANGASVDDALLAEVRSAAGPGSQAVPFGYAVATTAPDTPAVATPVVIAGTDFAAAEQLDRWWQVSHWPNAAEVHVALAGVRALALVTPGQTISLRFRLPDGSDRYQQFRVAGSLHTGGPEDSRFYLPLADFASLTGAGPTTIEVQVPGSAREIEGAIARIRAVLPPGADVHALRQLVVSESRIVDRTRNLMLFSVILVSLMVGVSVLATLSASVLERSKDFAIMKALGGSHGKLQALFALEATALAVAGAVSGLMLGTLGSVLIGRVNFGTPIFPTAAVIPPVLLLNLLVALAAAIIPLRLLRTIEPAALLKGE